jgi:hypothetical protein
MVNKVGLEQISGYFELSYYRNLPLQVWGVSKLR